jgi:hypothetical protein
MLLLAVRIEFPDAMRFYARITPMRGSIVAPPFSATSINASIAARHSGSA